jgi:lipopolysaccharide/colanic/teichoic acid biosynthesis glycosyltransferase
LLRKLPGLINVLRGEMSLVGPRPIGVLEASESIEQSMTLTLRPGLTGPWRQARTREEQALLDLYYIRSYSIWLDVQVLLVRTLARLRGRSRSEALFARTRNGKALAQLTRERS